ncbi:6616_t:CDS:2 [Ambispora gerdemannii]|uniref:6616_t:CDS:1 n=1 Tax=Ambispora gerdemannii TaxID=144530 RepID=A0A9N8ZV28_9GLOM|nr:6616_t:CDS:2 [Ambispora gerdemannii]
MDYSALQMPVPQGYQTAGQSPQSSPRNSQGSRRPSSSPSTGRDRDSQSEQRRNSGNSTPAAGYFLDLTFVFDTHGSLISKMSSIEKTVTTLLVATKSLLESLTAWSQGRLTQQQVFEVYTIQGQVDPEFRCINLIMNELILRLSDLQHIPNNLRFCLETALKEEPSQASLEFHLPKIRDVIVILLQGLKEKQAIYRQRFGSDDTTTPLSSPPQLHRQLSAGPPVQGKSQASDLSSNDSSLRRNVSAPPAATLQKTSNTSRLADPLDALKQSNVLERRASKRYSAFAHKSTSRSNLNADSQDGTLHPSIAPPHQHSPSLDHTKEEDEVTLAEDPADSDATGESIEQSTPRSSIDTKYEAEQHEVHTNVSQNIPIVNIQDTSTPKGLTLFLQLGKDIKKTTYDGDISIPALRMLFIEKFSYNPGMDDFPNIYIKDTTSGVLYELENLDEVKNNSVLALNVEALEQVKKHFDQSIATLAKEIRDIKKSFSENNDLLRRSAVNANASARQAPSHTQLRELAKKVLANVKQKEAEENSAKSGASYKSSLITEKFVSDIKNQHDEVQNLRRDLGVMRQLYTEFQDETQQLVQSLTEKTSAVKQVAMTSVGSARSFISAGKTKLDTSSSQLLARVDELQDIIDELKADVTIRKCKPSQSSVNHVRKESAEVEKELASLSSFVKTVKPQWKKTWEEELQTIVEEQKFLTHQEELLEDMQDDHHKLTEVFDSILKVVEIKSKSRPKEFRPVPQDESFEGLKTVLQEVRGIAPDSERRLRAMAQAEKLRERELANRIDEFEQELSQFVTENKLKKTGGAQEVERLRKKKDEDALKELFKASASSS